MRRRDLIVTAGIAMFSGCSALSSSGPDGENDSMDTESKSGTVGGTERKTAGGESTPTGPRRFDIPESVMLGETVELAVEPTRSRRRRFDIPESVMLGETVELAVESTDIGTTLVEASGDERRAPEGSMYLLAEIRATNVGSVTSVLPPADAFAVLADGTQGTRIDVGSDISFSEPVSGTPYIGQPEAVPDAEQRGYLLFEIARDATDPEIIWKPSTWDDERITYWEGQVDPAVLPAVSITNMDVPDSVENGAKIPVTLSVHNDGGRKGEFEEQFIATRDGGLVLAERTFSATVEPNETVTLEATIDVDVPGTIRVAVPEMETRTVSVLPATRTFGEVFRTANDLDIRVEFVDFADRYAFESEGSIGSGDERKLAAYRLTISNPMDDARPLPPLAGFDGLAGDYRNISVVRKRGKTIKSLDSGAMYSRRFTEKIRAGAQASGIVVNEVPADATESELAVVGSFPTDRQSDQYCTWSESGERDES